MSGTANGIRLQDGGSITNSGGAKLSGGNGVVVIAGIATVGNVGAIAATANGSAHNGTVSNSFGILLGGGGLVTNSSSGIIRATGSYGVAIDIAGSGSVNNAGTIEATGTRRYYLASGGIFLSGGGSVTNAAGALIESPRYGIFIKKAPGSIVNSGTIDCPGTSGIAVDFFRAAGVLNNLGARALIEGGVGVSAFEAGAIINNTGTILSNAYGGDAINMDNYGGGTIVNGTHGLIGASGRYGAAIYTTGQDSSVENAGVIDNAIKLFGGGTVVNSAGGVIAGAISLSSGSVINAGTIETTVVQNNGDGVDCENLVNQETGLVTTTTGVELTLGTLDNSGTIKNTATIGDAVMLNQDQKATNGAAALIKGFVGVDLELSSSLVNSGRIIGDNQIPAGGNVGYGVRAEGLGGASGSILNNQGGLIRGYRGMYDNSMTVINSGSIVGTGNYGDGIICTNAIIINRSTGFILGATAVQVLYGPCTVQNFGTIASTVGGDGDAVLLRDRHEVLIDEPGSVFEGMIGGSGGTLELAGVGGVLSGLGSTIVGFGTITVLAAANWTVAGAQVVDDNAIWQDYGTVIETGHLKLGDSDGSGHLAVRAGGTFDIADNVNIGSGSSDGSIGNHGLLEKTGGSGASLILPGIENDGTIEAKLGTLVLEGAVTGTGIEKIKAAGTLELQGTVANTQTILFAPSTGGDLVLDDSSGAGLAFDGVITGFSGGDSLDLVTFAFSAKPSLGWSQDGSSGTLTVTEGAAVAKITLFGQYAAAGFKPANDGGGGTVVTYTAPTEQAALANPHR